MTPLDEGAMGDMQEGKPKPGRAAKSIKWGEGQTGREAEWLWGSSRARGRGWAGSEGALTFSFNASSFFSLSFG